MKKLFTILLTAFCMHFVTAQTICLVGDGATVGDLPSAEQKAYNWALGFYGADATYMSFSDVAASGLPAATRVVWFHFEDDPTLPASAAGAATNIESLLDSGGGLLASGFATEYAVTVNATTVAPTETIDNDPAGPDAAWGIKPLAWMNANPIFANMAPTTDWADPNWGGFRTVAADVAGREAIRWWTGGTYPGTPIAVMPWWDVNNNEIPIVGKISKGSGAVITCTAPGFNWVNADINSAEAQGNLERMTANMLNSLNTSVKYVMVGDGATVGDLPSAEQNAYNWGLGALGGEAMYMSFADLAANGLPSSTQTVWYHFEDDPTLPASDDMAASTIEAFINNGGGLVVSGFATQYVTEVNATTVAPTEIIDNDPAGPDAAWGVKALTGQEMHPVFDNMTLTTDWADPNWGGYRTIGANTAGREAMAWWTGGAYPGMPIAAMPWWDASNTDIPVIGSISSGLGRVITCTAPGYNWVNAAANATDDATAQANLEQLTTNMLNLSGQGATPQYILVGEAASIDAFAGSEKNAYNWATSHFGAAAVYHTFDELNIQGIPQSAKAIWFHLEDDPTMPTSAANVASMVELFVENGGRLFVSSFATPFVVDVNATTVGPTELIDNDPAGPDAAWGIKPLAGQEMHPIFSNLTETTDWADPNWGGFRTIGANTAGHEAMNWWTGGAFTGTPLAVMPWWDAANSDIPVIGLLEKGQGEVLFATAPGFQWLPAPANAMDDAVAQANLEQLTHNILTFDASPGAEIILVGEGNLTDLPAGEQNAYQWAIDNLPLTSYMTFDQVANNGLPFTTEAVWYHLEDTSMVAASAAGAATVIGDFANNGGGVLLSGFATQYVVAMGATTVAQTEIIDNDPAGPDAAWGVKALAGLESHPFFDNMTLTTDWADPNWGGYRTIGANTAGREAMAWWTGGSYPGSGIAVMPWWDANNPDIPVIGEIVSGMGAVVTATAPGYNWVSRDSNLVDDPTAQANLEQLTENMLMYLYDPQPAPRILVSTATNPIVEGTEDGVTITVMSESTIFADPIDGATWTIAPLPPGVTVGSVVRDNDNQCTITLSGNADDYDTDILDFTITIPAAQFVGLGGVSELSSVGDVVFDAIVEIMTSGNKVALLGDKETIAELDEDEQEAYNWALATFGNDATYFWIQDVVIDPSILDSMNVAWWHYDKFVDIPLLFDNTNTDAALQNFRSSGRGIFLSGAATQYVTNLGVTTKGPNQVQKADMPFQNPDPWGYLSPIPDHPVFENLTNPFFTLFTDGGREDLLSWWNLDANFDDPVNPDPADRFDGIHLTSTEWDASFSVIVSSAEFDDPGQGGNVIAVGAGAYDWYIPNGTNDLRADLELYTFNILNYLSGDFVNTNDLKKQKLEVVASPNPFEQDVNIFFVLQESENVTIEIFDANGRLMTRLADNERLYPGGHNINWNAENASQGFYFYKVTTDNYLGYGKLVLQKQ